VNIGASVKQVCRNCKIVRRNRVVRLRCVNSGTCSAKADLTTRSVDGLDS
jgi:ribosomal protein L36